ncbi:MAG: metallophosphoesterase [Dysgonomonas sp.]|nr:metallophosphoesterase [Dysgonomonas sp.]
MSNKKKKFSVFILLLFSVACLCAIYGYFEARNIIWKEITYTSNDIPDAFVGKKIIFISDIHCNKYFAPEDVRKLVSDINKRKPDIILIGGDNVGKDSTYYKPFFDEIGKLQSKHGIFSVLGNHDHWEGRDLIQQNIINCGFNVCDNKSYWIKEGNDSIKIGGVGEYWEDVQILNNTIGDILASDFCILLSHNPDYMEDMNTNKVDLMLSGHTHAGQVTFFGLWAPVMPGMMHPEYPQTDQKYRYDWIKKDDTSLYITSGIGMGDFPFRFFAAPEIVEITLKK